jgi:cell division protein FtsQ
VLMPEAGADILAHFGEDQFLSRYQRYKAHVAEWRQQYPKLAAVDLRYEQQVVLQMTPGSGGAQTTTATNDGKPIMDTAPIATNAAPVKPSAGVKAGPDKTTAAKVAAHRAAATAKAAKEKNKKHPVPQRRTTQTGTNHAKAGSATHNTQGQ